MVEKCTQILSICVVRVWEAILELMITNNYMCWSDAVASTLG